MKKRCIKRSKIQDDVNTKVLASSRYVRWEGRAQKATPHRQLFLHERDLREQNMCKKEVKTCVESEKSGEKVEKKRN